jgi:hypothetical protein
VALVVAVQEVLVAAPVVGRFKLDTIAKILNFYEIGLKQVLLMRGYAKVSIKLLATLNF